MDDAAEPYLDKLRALPFALNVAFAQRPTHGSVEIDGFIRIKTPTGNVVLPYAEKRSHLSDATVRVLIDRARSLPHLLVLAPVVGRNVAAAFEEAGVNFVDLDGNCFINIDQRYIAKIQGQPRAQVQAADRALRAPALRVLFALLIDKDLIRETARAIALGAGGVSPQTANEVRRRLAERGLVLESKKGWQWTPAGRRYALDDFITGYRNTLFPSLLIDRFRTREADPNAVARLVGETLADNLAWRFGGGAACDRLTHYYRGEQTLVYVEEMPPDLVKHLRLVVDSAGPIAFARSPGPSAFNAPDPRAVHPLLVYADLLAEHHDRARDAAREIYDRFVRELETP